MLEGNKMTVRTGYEEHSQLHLNDESVGCLCAHVTTLGMQWGLVPCRIPSKLSFLINAVPESVFVQVFNF
jgi:sulfite exporter TauE/SafE